VQARSVFALPLDQWTYEFLASFLRDHVRENERIEYKSVFDDTLGDSLASMANGEGGLIFVGVSEKKIEKIPDKWPLLEANKDHVVRVYNKIASETQPTVPVQVCALADGTAGQQVVVIRVERGPMPPYFVRNRGVKIRVGDGDIDADPRALEQLFARRQDALTVRRRHRENSQAANLPLPGNSTTVRLEMFIEPMLSAERFGFNEGTARSLHSLMQRHLRDFDPEPARTPEWLEFTVSDGTGRLMITGDGILIFAEAFLDLAEVEYVQPEEQRPIYSLDWFLRIRSVVELSQAAYATLAGYEGDLFLAVIGRNIYQRPLSWPSVGAPTSLRRGKLPSEMALWIQDTSFPVHGDAIAVARTMTKALFWSTGYNGYEDFIDSWGSAVQARR
jgi:hypothetical protein